MFPTKAPGSDGFHALFYQHFWDIVKGKTVENYFEILNNGGSLQGLNHTNIALIPKIGHPKVPSNFRPISLCNVSYKIIAKVLANRLKLVLNAVISESQIAFVPGRLIFDNLMAGYECIDYITNKRQGKKGYVAMKLDMSKAYDRVKWCFLKHIMLNMGFSSVWVTLTMKCISTVSFCILINGEPQGFFLPERGLFRGIPCPLIYFCYVQKVFRVCFPMLYIGGSFQDVR